MKTPNGKNIFYLVGAVGLGYALYKIFSGYSSVEKGATKLWEGLTFDKSSLGPEVQLTPGAKLSQQDYIDKGYLVIDAQGNSHITPAGEAYISQQKAKLQSGG